MLSGAQKRKEQEDVGEMGREYEEEYEQERCEEVKEGVKLWNYEGKLMVQRELMNGGKEM